ncbi:MAG: cyclic nucleotide-binding domain-containing protein [Dehalococcoidia bacterium]|nr:cyclic nucleotide-binding domain-containing protein [Dehalococcoidia bacterium]
MVSGGLLKGCSIFEELSDAELEKVMKLSHSQEYEAGVTVFKEGGTADQFHVLNKGKIALQMNLSLSDQSFAKRITVDTVGKWEAVGWSALVEPHRYTLTAVCLEPTKVLGIDATRLRALLEEDHGMACKIFRRLIGMVASRLEETRRVLISERLVSMDEPRAFFPGVMG